MSAVYGLFTILFGLIIGSFLNALSFRYHTGRGMGGRSRCMRCGVALGVADLIPVLSFLFLRGRCRHCRSPIALQYPVIEALAGVLSYGAWLLHPHPAAFLLATLIWATLLFVVVYDLRHTVLPTAALVLLCVVGFAMLFVSCVDLCSITKPTLMDLAAGLVIGGPLLFLSLVSRGRWMGWGDGVLALALGWMLGVSEGVAALLIAFWSGSIAGLVLVAYSRRSRRKNGGYTPWDKSFGTTQKNSSDYPTGYTMESAIPFAPFLAFGALAAHALHINILSFPLF